MIVIHIFTGDIVPYVIKDNIIFLNSTNPEYTEDNCIVTTWENYRKMIQEGKFNNGKK